MVRSAGLTLWALPLVVSLGCASRSAEQQARAAPQGRLITAAEIQQSNARTAWQALRRLAPELALTENPAGEPVGIASRRGIASLHAPGTPRIVLNGMRLANMAVLSSIPADAIASIRIVGGIDGTTYYGSDTAVGVIFIETKTSPEPR